MHLVLIIYEHSSSVSSSPPDRVASSSYSCHSDLSSWRNQTLSRSSSRGVEEWEIIDGNAYDWDVALTWEQKRFMFLVRKRENACDFDFFLGVTIKLSSWKTTGWTSSMKKFHNLMNLKSENNFVASLPTQLDTGILKFEEPSFKANDMTFWTKQIYWALKLLVNASDLNVFSFPSRKISKPKVEFEFYVFIIVQV